MNNNENNNNAMYMEDNSFDNQGIVDNGEQTSLQSDTQQAFKSVGNSALGFGKTVANGVKPGLDRKNNPGLGVPRKNNNSNNDNINNKKKNNFGNKNPAKGQKNDPNTNKNPGQGQKRSGNTGNNAPKDKNPGVKGLGPKGNPLAAGAGLAASKLGLGKKNKDNDEEGGVVAPNLNEIAQKGIKAAWTVAPIQVKIAVLAFSIIPILIIAMILFLAVFGGTTAAVTASMCGDTSSSSSYNGEDYSGSSDVKEFMCKMQDPLASKSLYTITGKYGTDRGDHIHAGLDLGSYGHKNIPVYAAQAGIVTSAGYHSSMGYHVKISHGGVIETVYMHMVSGSLKVKKGDKVGKGQQIGKMGNTGNSFGVHLHFEIRTLPNREHHNPTPYFSDKESFKKNCGSLWDGELAGDSANVANDTTSDYTSTSSDVSSAECCDTSGSGSSEPVEGLPPILTQEFVDGAISTQTKYKVPASLTLAQIIQESSGRYPGHLSGLAYECKNLFGIKKGSSSGPTCTFNTKEETSGGGSYTVSAQFRKYDSYKESIEDHGKFFVENKRYSDCFSKKTGDEWARCIKAAGYATDTDYAEKLIGNMKKYNLYQYDEYTSSGVCTLGKGSFDGKIWYFDQTDYKEPYGSYGTIATHGCGPTAMAIAVSSILKEEHNPVELTNYACSNGYCTNGGTAYAFFGAAAKKYDLKIKQVSKSNSDEIFAALNGGKSIVIVIMGPGKFTSGGHFITLTGSDGNQVFVHDPNNGDGKKYNKLWDFNVIKSEAKGSSPFWIISK